MNIGCSEPDFREPAHQETSAEAARRIKREVAQKHKVTVADLDGDRRLRPVARARQEAMARIRRETAKGRNSAAWVGLQVGDRDHSTVLHACEAHDARAAETA